MGAVWATRHRRDSAEYVGIQDHPYQGRFLDTWMLMATVIARTEQVSVFPDVANLPLPPPAVPAKSAASLDVLSGGRFELGLGAGSFWEAVEPWEGDDGRRARRSRSSAEVVGPTLHRRIPGTHARSRAWWSIGPGIRES